MNNTGLKTARTRPARTSKVRWNTVSESRKHPSDYLHDLEEWQDHQYDPGHWTGGSIPPHLKYPRRPLGILLVIMGGLSLLAVGMDMMTDSSLDSVVGNILGLLTGSLFLAAGIRIIRTRK